MLKSSRMYVTLEDEQIQRARTPWRLHSVLWDLKFVGPHYVSCFKSPTWRLETSGGSWIFGRVLLPCVTPSVCDTVYKDLVSKVNISMSDPWSKDSASRIVTTVFGQWITRGILRTEPLRVLVCTTTHRSLKAYCAILVRRSNVRYQTSPRESTQRQKVELWARNVREFCRNDDFHAI
jgi:hypothetical protein